MSMEKIMESKEFFIGLADIFEIDEDRVSMSLVFDAEDVVWDSLAIVSTIALADECFGIMLNGQALGQCKNVGDVMKLIQDLSGH